MIQAPIETPSDWDGVALVAFDVDGTLYNQWPLRLRMAREMLHWAVRRRTFRFIAVVTAYRRIRERLSEQGAEDFERRLIAETAAATGCSGAAVRAIVGEWIERRPLRYLARCRYPGLPSLFAGLRRCGKTIGIFSDYPARAKLAALNLAADFVVSAHDPGIGTLKPHPRGLEYLMAAAGVTPPQTLLIGDRQDRDGLAALRAGARILLRSPKPIKGWQTFRRYDDPLFAPILNEY